MAERIKGITIEFDSDVKGLKKGLAQINGLSKQTNRALNEVNRALKLNPNNITLLTQKQRLLKQRTAEVSDRVKILKMRLDEMKNDPAVDKKSAEFQKLQRELIKAQAYQKKFAREMFKFGNAKFTAVGNSLQTFGKKLSSVTRRARQAAAALTGIALFKGFQRLKTLDDVSTELEKLGYRGEKLAQIMEDATESVSGTKYALTDMSKVAKGALGAGVEKSYKLGDYLQRVADLAAVGGVGVDKMGAMMNKALSKGVVDAKLLNQMNANGIPIYNALADSMGVTTDELMKMVRSGEVGFDDLYKATDKYKGLAQELGTETLSGAVTVLGQQFGLIGAEFLQGAYEPIKSGVKGIVSWIKKLRSDGTFKAWGTAVGEAIQYFVEWFKNGEASTDGLSKKAQGLITAFAPFVKIIGTIVKGFIALPTPVKQLAIAFALVGGPLLTVVGGFVKLIGIVSSFGAVAKAVGGLSKAFFLLTGINPIVLGIVAGIAALITIGIAVYKNWDTIKKKGIAIWNAIKTALTKVTTAIKTAVLKNFNTLKTTISTIWTNLKTKVSTTATNLKNAVTNTFSTLKTRVSDQFKKIRDAIKNPIQTAKEKVSEIVQKIKDFFPLSLGKIVSFKLPKISIGSKSTKVGDKDVKSPTFGIGGWKHYAKAMRSPYLFTSATGIVAGEAGDELLYGKKALLRDIAAATNGGGITINVYGSDNMSVNELAAAVEQRLIQLQKRRTQAWA